ncbi:VOC family protein [Zobellella sp. DQSA1]|uniref:VOC family protein n=1 Tax=Zobellella sp. DQSA1 TaxID=3342386 RepID=UPI0035C1F61D
MAIDFNHTIVWCHDKQASARFLTALLGLPEPVPFGAMLVVRLDNGASLDFYQKTGPVAAQHYAFLVGEDDFERIFTRLREQGLTYWADPARQRAGSIYRLHGGRGVYFDDPDGHLLEVMTRPYPV